MNQDIINFLYATNPARTPAAILVYQGLVTCYDDFDDTIMLSILNQVDSSDGGEDAVFDRLCSVLAAEAYHILLLAGVLVDQATPLKILGTMLLPLYTSDSDILDTDDIRVLFNDDPINALAEVVASYSSDEVPLTKEQVIPHITSVSNDFIAILTSGDEELYLTPIHPALQRYVEKYPDTLISSLVQSRTIAVGASLALYKAVFSDGFPLPEDEGLPVIIGMVILSDTPPVKYLDEIVDLLSIHYTPDVVAKLTLATSTILYDLI